MLPKIKSLLGDKAKKFAGKTDFLEAVCAAAALLAAADGDISDNEIDKAMAAVKSNASLAGAFDARSIEATMTTMISRANNRVGKNGLRNEIGDIKKDFDMAETVLLAALDVADDGGIGDAEMAELRKIADLLGLDLNKYL